MYEMGIGELWYRWTGNRSEGMERRTHRRKMKYFRNMERREESAIKSKSLDTRIIHCKIKKENNIIKQDANGG